MSTGGRARSRSAGKDPELTGCRCLTMSATDSPITFVTGRPRGFGRAVFLTASAPLIGVSRGAVSDIVVRACERAGVPPVGCHCLRHTVASELLSRGAGLAEIGQVLRHRDLRTTAIYAKVDRRALSGLALAWPGSER